MKIKTLILATYILLLTLQPMFSVFTIVSNNETEACCSNSLIKKDQSGKKNNKSEKQKQCNPFKVCSSCVIYLFTSQPFFALSKTEISTKQNFIYQSVFTGQFEPYFWQPPKIA